jgi:hypothetical protein
MNFPRLKDFKFSIDNTFIIPGIFVGRGDLIANEIYGNPKFYKPLCEANNINLPYGTRVGIRPIEQALEVEAKLDELSENDAKLYVQTSLDNTIPGNLNWNNYGDVFYGFISDLYEGRLLLVPSSDNCLEWLRRFEKLDVKN